MYEDEIVIVGKEFDQELLAKAVEKREKSARGQSRTMSFAKAYGSTDRGAVGILEEVGEAENSGGSCDYYKVDIMHPTTPELNSDNLPKDVTYTAECNDIIEALNMTYAEANMFKEIWRSAAARTLGKLKVGHDSVRGAEKIVFFAERNMIQKVAAADD